MKMVEQLGLLSANHIQIVCGTNPLAIQYISYTKQSICSRQCLYELSVHLHIVQIPIWLCTARVVHIGLGGDPDSTRGHYRPFGIVCNRFDNLPESKQLRGKKLEKENRGFANQEGIELSIRPGIRDIPRPRCTSLRPKSVA